MARRGGDGVSSWCNCKQPKTRINAITGGDVSIKDGVITDFHSDWLVRLVSVYCEDCGVEVTA